MGLPALLASHPGAAVATAPAASCPPGSDDWTQYHKDLGHSGFNYNGACSPSSKQLQLNGSWGNGIAAGGAISSQPMVATVNGESVAYWGSWDGYEHATVVSSGANFWPSLPKGAFVATFTLSRWSIRWPNRSPITRTPTLPIRTARPV
jgi:hypothetical protein